MDFVLIGKVLNTHGIKGELKVESYTDFADKRFEENSFIYLGAKYQKLQVKNYRLHKGFILLSLIDYEDINLVLPFKDQYLYKHINDIEQLNKGEYYFKDLKDLDVFVDNKEVGKVLQVEEGPKYNYLRIQIEDQEKLVPFLPTFIKKVDLENKKIEIIKMEGLL